MIISDLQHLEIVNEETQIQGQGGHFYHDKYNFKGSNKASASTDNTAIAEGKKTDAFTYGETNTYTDNYTSASNSSGVAYSSSK